VTVEKVILGDAEIGDISDVINTDRYPINDYENSSLKELIQYARKELAEDGCCILRKFLSPEALEKARQESNELSPKAYFSQQNVNSYFTEDDPTLPKNDPRRIFMERTSGFVTRDMISPDTIIHRIYVSPMIKRFIAACLEEELIYEYSDPFAGLVINVIPEDSQQPWHFDTNEFIVTMMTQKPSDGGIFEYSPMIRTHKNENLPGVANIVSDKDHTQVKVLELNPGDLQIFKGRFSVHRVTKVEGNIERHTAIFAYSEQPNVIGRAERTRQLYGRLSEAHLISEANKVRRDSLLD
jgi:hypothetical protein